MTLYVSRFYYPLLMIRHQREVPPNFTLVTISAWFFLPHDGVALKERDREKEIEAKKCVRMGHRRCCEHFCILLLIVTTALRMAADERTDGHSTLNSKKAIETVCNCYFRTTEF